MELKNVCGHTYVKNFLGANPVVFDCGANYGLFSSRIAKESMATVYGFEPDPRLFPILPEVENVRYFNMAVSGSGKDLTLNLGEEKCSSGYFTEGIGQSSLVVKSTRLNDFCGENNIHKVDLLKLDIEGAEIEVLSMLPVQFLETVGQITVEFHDFLQSSEVPRIQQVIERMRQCGFYYVKFTYYDYSNCLFINSRLHPVSYSSKISILIKKYLFGIKRLLSRTFKLKDFA
jgi:FkbM family methyltransferase